MTDRDWFAQFEAQARADQDEQRLRLVQLVYEADWHRETAPDQMLRLLEEGCTLARLLDEPWWALFFEDRRAGALMKYKGDARAGLELAVRNALEARKPLYQGFPWRFRIHDHLIVGYLNSDPAGYADEIGQALDWLASYLPQEGSPKYLLLARRRWLASELGDFDQAERLALQALTMAAQDPDQLTARSHAVFCYSHLAELSWARQDWEGLHERACLGEELAQETGHQLELAEFHMWQALLARRSGNEERAQRLWRRSTRRVAQLGMPPDHIFFDAITAFHEQADEFHLALRARDHELTLLLGKGRFASEFRCRCFRLELRMKLGLSIDNDLAEAHLVAEKLRRPQQARTRLAELERRAR